MVEFKDDGESPPCLMEVNGRFWGSLQLAIDAGVDFPRLWVSILKGESAQPSADFKEGVTLRWFWGDVKRFFFIMRGAPSGYPSDFPPISQGLKELLGRQPQGTRLEMWRAHDPLPAMGELVGGIRELVTWRDRSELAGSNGASSQVNLIGSNGSKADCHELKRKRPWSKSTVLIREATSEELPRWDEMVMRFDNYRVSHKLAWMRSLQGQ